MSKRLSDTKIPEDWLEGIDKIRLFEEISKTTQSLNSELETYFGFKPESQDQAIHILAEQWSKTFDVVFNILKSIIRFGAITNLFENDFKDHFPCDENHKLLLTPDVIDIIFRNSSADDLHVIRENRTELIDSKLLQKWLGLDFDFVN